MVAVCWPQRVHGVCGGAVCCVEVLGGACVLCGGACVLCGGACVLCGGACVLWGCACVLCGCACVLCGCACVLSRICGSGMCVQNEFMTWDEGH